MGGAGKENKIPNSDMESRVGKLNEENELVGHGVYFFSVIPCFLWWSGG